MRDFIHRWLRIPHVLHIGIDKGPTHPRHTIIFIHGLANSHAMWTEIIDHIDTSVVRVIAVDLLGFGDSPKPPWQHYKAEVHARSLRMTLLRHRVRGPVIIVGHSLGALVAVQYAKKYARSVKSLVLFGPPFYKPSNLAKEVRLGPLRQIDDAYHMLYRNSRYRSQIARRLALFMKSAGLLSKHFTVTDETMPAIISSLEMSIENQTSLSDAKTLNVPTHIMYGQFDPFVLKSNLRELKQANEYVSLEALPVGHEIKGIIYKKAAVSRINYSINQFDNL